MSRPLPQSIFIVLSLLCCHSAQAASISATVDRNETDMQNPLLLTVTIEGSQTAEPSLPDLSMFDVQTRGRSSNVSMINGHFTSSASYGFVLSPKRPGTFSIGATQVVIDGKTYSSEPFSVSVAAHAADDAAAGANAALFITSDVTTKTPYVGQQVRYTWRFFRRERVGTANVSLPEFTDLTTESLGEKREFETLLRGQRYTVTEIRKVLYAQEPGAVTISGTTLQCEVFTGNRMDDMGSPFDGFFGRGARQTKTLRTDPIVLHVQKVPVPPGAFSDLVGQVSVQAHLGHNELKVGDSTTLTLEVSGTADIKRALEPAMPPMPAFKTYDDKPSVSSHIKDGLLYQTKTFKKALVPTETGTLSVGPIAVTYFDPTTQAYRVASVAAMAVHVSAGATQGGGTAQGGQLARRGLGEGRDSLPPVKQEVQILGDDILPIYKRLDALERHRFRGSLWGLVFGLPVGFALAAFFVARKRHRGSSVAQQHRRASALRDALSHAKALQALLEEKAWVTAAGEVSRIVRAFLGAKFGVEGLALTAAEARIELERHGIEATLAFEVESLLNRCEAAQYGAIEAADVTFANLSEQLKTLLTALHRRLP